MLWRAVQSPPFWTATGGEKGPLVAVDEQGGSWSAPAVPFLFSVCCRRETTQLRGSYWNSWSASERSGSALLCLCAGSSLQDCEMYFLRNSPKFRDRPPMGRGIRYKKYGGKIHSTQLWMVFS